MRAVLFWLFIVMTGGAATAQPQNPLLTNIHIFDEPCLVEVTQRQLRGAPLFGPADPGSMSNSPLPMLPLPMLNFPVMVAPPSALEARAAFDLIVAGRLAPQCIVPVSALQAEILQRTSLRLVNMAIVRPQDPTTAQMPGIPPLVQDPPALDTNPRLEVRIFSDQCVMQAALAAVESMPGSDIRRIAEELVLTGRSPVGCVVNIRILRPTLMQRLVEDFPAALDDLQKNLGP
jgi:hypothetical protein